LRGRCCCGIETAGNGSRSTGHGARASDGPCAGPDDAGQYAPEINI
jgi:hypothetical protein